MSRTNGSFLKYENIITARYKSFLDDVDVFTTNREFKIVKSESCVVIREAISMCWFGGHVNLDKQRTLFYYVNSYRHVARRRNYERNQLEVIMMP